MHKDFRYGLLVFVLVCQDLEGGLDFFFVYALDGDGALEGAWGLGGSGYAGFGVVVVDEGVVFVEGVVVCGGEFC